MEPDVPVVARTPGDRAVWPSPTVRAGDDPSDGALGDAVGCDDIEGKRGDGGGAVGTCTDAAGEDVRTFGVGVGSGDWGTVTAGADGVVIERVEMLTMPTVGSVTDGTGMDGTVTEGPVTDGTVSAVLGCGGQPNNASTTNASTVRTRRPPPFMVRADLPNPTDSKRADLTAATIAHAVGVHARPCPISRLGEAKTDARQ